jgi:uncharacterized membrane protein YfhO
MGIVKQQKHLAKKANAAGSHVPKAGSPKSAFASHSSQQRFVHRGAQKQSNDILGRIESFSLNQQVLIAAAMLAVLATILFARYLFGQQTYLFKDIGSDSINGYQPHLALIVDYVKKHGLPGWSFQQGMGSNIFGISALGEPFTLLTLLLGQERFALFIAFVEWLKVLSGGAFFFLYARTAGGSAFTSLIACILFAFSGYMIVGGTWMLFSTDAVYAALLLYAFERLFSKNSWWLFPLPVALITLFQPVYLYIYGLFLVLYATTRCFGEYGWDIRRYSVLLARMVALGALGAALGSVTGLSMALQIVQGPRVSGEASYTSKLSGAPILGFGDFAHNVTAIARFFSSDLLGTGSNFKGWYNYLEAPMAYCGILTLVVMPQIFAFAHRQQRILFGGILALCFVPIVFPYFRYAFWVFSGDYYRAFSFVVSLFLLFLAARALLWIDRERRLSLPILGGTVVGLFLLLTVPFSGEAAQAVNNLIRGGVMVLIVLYAGLLVLLKTAATASLARIALVVLVSLEAVAMSYPALNSRQTVSSEELTQRIGYNDFTLDAVAYLRSVDSSFYRVDKDYSSGLSIHRSINDAKIQGFRGTALYHNFSQPNYIRFLGKTDVIDMKDEFSTRWAPGVLTRPMLQTICNVKYVFSRGEQNASYWANAGFERIKQVQDVNILRNTYAVPFGFCYDSTITEQAFARLSATQKDKMLLRAAVLADNSRSGEGFAVKSSQDTSVGIFPQEYMAYVRALRQDTVRWKTLGENELEGLITLNTRKILMLSIPFDAGWTLSLNGRALPTRVVNTQGGEALERMNLGFMGCVLPKGAHTIRLEYTPPLRREGALISLSALVFYGMLVVITRMKNRQQKQPSAQQTGEQSQAGRGDADTSNSC